MYYFNNKNAKHWTPQLIGPVAHTRTYRELKLLIQGSLQFTRLQSVCQWSKAKPILLHALAPQRKHFIGEALQVLLTERH